MVTKTAARPASPIAHLGRLPPTLEHLLQSGVIELPFGSIAIGQLPRGGKVGRNKAKQAQRVDPGTMIAGDLHMAMIGRVFLLGTLQLLAQLMASAGPLFEQGHTAPIQRRRAKWGSKTRVHSKRRKAAVA